MQEENTPQEHTEEGKVEQIYTENEDAGKSKNTKIAPLVLVGVLLCIVLVFVLVRTNTQPPEETPPPTEPVTQVDPEEKARAQALVKAVQDQTRSFSGKVTGMSAPADGSYKYITVLTRIIDIEKLEEQNFKFEGASPTVQREIRVVLHPTAEMINTSIDTITEGDTVYIEIGRSVYEAGDKDVVLKIETLTPINE